MSLFKAREWWCTTVGENELFDLGCLCVADVTSTHSDQIIVGSYHGRLAVYQPHPTRMDKNKKAPGFTADDVICELYLASPILQIGTGQFASAPEGLKLAVLQPRKLTVFAIAAMPGVTEHGTQYQLRSLYEHKFQRTAFNFCWGPFGGVKGKDFICVQSMDGTVSVFEQESFSFSRFLPGTLLPGPIGYVAKTDSIVTVASSRQVDCFKFQVLATSRDDQTKEESQNIKSGRRVTVDWSFLINETAIDLVVTTFDAAPLAVMVLGERNLYALSEAGQLLFMKKFDFNPCCFLPYSGSNGNIRYLVVTHTQSLLVYENMTLKWAAQMTSTPVQIKVGAFKGLKGVTVALNEGGRLSCSYLGTEPSMVSPPSACIRELDYAGVEAEMNQLQQIIKEQQSKSSIPTPSQSSDEDIRLSVDVPSALDKLSKAVVEDIVDEVAVPSITVTVSVKAKSSVHNVKLTCNVVQPLVAVDATTIIPSVVPGHPVDKQVTVFMKCKSLPSDLVITILATYYTNAGAPKVAQTTARLPLSLVIRPCAPVKNATYKITIDTNKSPVNLGDLFSDLWGVNTDASANVVGFKYYGLAPVVSLLASKSSQRYRIQCDSFAYMWHMMQELVTRLASRFKMGSSSDFRIYYDSPLPLQEYFEHIHQHFECRCKADAMMKQLDEHVTQFRVAQKRLLIMFKDKTPTSLKNLDILLDSSFKQIMAVADEVERNGRLQQSTSAELSCATRIIALLIRLWLNLCPADVAALEAALTSIVNDATKQGWEEMTDASVTYLLRTSLSKNAADATLNPAPVAIPKDTEKLSKHIALVCDRLGKGAKLTEGSTSGEPLRNHSSVDKVAKKNTELLTDKNTDDWSVNDDGHAAGSAASPTGISQSFDNTEISRPKRLPELASGEPSRDSQLSLAVEADECLTVGGKDFRKKSNRAVDNSTNPGDLGQNEDSDGAFYSGNNELVYEL